MAKVSKWALFVRAFFIALIASSASRVGGQDAAEENAWKDALANNTPQAYHRYMSLYPGGEFVLDAITALDRLGAIDNPVRGIEGIGGGSSTGQVY